MLELKFQTSKPFFKQKKYMKLKNWWRKLLLHDDKVINKYILQPHSEVFDNGGLNSVHIV